MLRSILSSVFGLYSGKCVRSRYSYCVSRFYIFDSFLNLLLKVAGILRDYVHIENQVIKQPFFVYLHWIFFLICFLASSQSRNESAPDFRFFSLSFKTSLCHSGEAMSPAFLHKSSHIDSFADILSCTLIFFKGKVAIMAALKNHILVLLSDC